MSATKGKWAAWTAERMIEEFDGTRYDYPEEFYIVAESAESAETPTTSRHPWTLATLHGGLPGDGEDCANARLMAAAPDLRDALAEALDLITVLAAKANGRAAEVLPEVVEKSRRALRKAEKAS